MDLSKKDWVTIVVTVLIMLSLYFSVGLKEVVIYAVFVAIALHAGHFFKIDMMPGLILAGTFTLMFLIEILWPKLQTSVGSGNVVHTILLGFLMVYLLYTAVKLKTGGTFMAKK